SRNFPEPYCLVFAASQHTRTVRRELDCGNTALVPSECPDKPRRGNIPKFQCAIVAACKHIAAIARERSGLEAASMANEGNDFDLGTVLRVRLGALQHNPKQGKCEGRDLQH